MRIVFSKLSLAAANSNGKFSQEYDPSHLLDVHRATIHLVSRIAGLEQTIALPHK